MKLHYLLPNLLLLSTHTASAQIPSAYAERLQFVLDSVCEVHNIKGASAAVAVPDVGVWEGVYGLSHAGVPITPNMFLGIGSNTKTFVAATILKLQEQGLLDLQDTIGTWIQHPNIAGSITIRQLLRHTSGLYNFTNSGPWSNAVWSDMSQLWDTEEVLQFVAAPTAVPGTTWSYSNTNYLVAGLIIEEVTGQPLGDVIHSTVLDPAGLDSTVYYNAATQDLAIPHIWSSAFTPAPYLEDLNTTYAYNHNSLMTAVGGAGAMLATAKDNALFWSKLMTGGILTNSQWTDMTTVVTINANLAYGLGVNRRSNFNGTTVWSHGGANVGFINENIADPNTGIGISVLTNQDSIGNSIILNQLVRVLHAVDIEAFTGIAEAADVSFSIHPNPATDLMYIDLGAATSISDVSIIDLTGRTVLQRSISPGLHQLWVEELPAGVYLVEVRTGAARGVRRVVVGG